MDTVTAFACAACGRMFQTMRQILISATLLMIPASALADNADFQPWLACAARVMAYDGHLWTVAYYANKHPDRLGYAQVDIEGYASVWAPPEKPWVQLHEACHVIQMSRGEDLSPSASSDQEAECRRVQERWRECD